ncbi:hypothetical protein Ancab_037413 [Ancistrocladus abbreviatus]
MPASLPFPPKAVERLTTVADRERETHANKPFGRGTKRRIKVDKQKPRIEDSREMTMSSRVFAQTTGNGDSRRSSGSAGTIARIRLENFMCHSNLQIEFGDYVNFITGQNGSGKSAILTALSIAFGCRAKSTQRAAALKDFIKTGCHHAVVLVEMKNQGEDAFKPEVYGDVINIERKISESASSIIIKDYQGRKVASGKDELRELVEHFNVQVLPLLCTIHWCRTLALFNDGIHHILHHQCLLEVEYLIRFWFRADHGSPMLLSPTVSYDLLGLVGETFRKVLP